MITLETIEKGHAQFTGPDFPKLIAYFKELGMMENVVNIQSGQVTYRSTDGQVLETTGYRVETPIAAVVDKISFIADLQGHQAGLSDFPAFCEDTARAGIYKWVTDLETMTCSYVDLQDQVVLVEQIPSA